MLFDGRVGRRAICALVVSWTKRSAEMYKAVPRGQAVDDDILAGYGEDCHSGRQNHPTKECSLPPPERAGCVGHWKYWKSERKGNWVSRRGS